MRFCRWYRWCSSLRQGSAAHSSLGGASGALVSSMRLAPLHSARWDLRQHILGITPGIGFSDHPTKQRHAVGTCECYHKSGSPSHLGIAVLIVPSGSFFHAQTNVSVDITEELSPNVRMIHRREPRAGPKVSH